MFYVKIEFIAINSPKFEWMKKLFQFSVIISVFFFAAGCSKSGDDTTINDGPDVSDFSVPIVSPVIVGKASTVTIMSTSMGNGVFTVAYELSGNNTASGQSAVVNMLGNTGSFSTPVLTNSGSTTLNIISLTNDFGKTTTLTKNNVVSFSDSTGLISASVNGVSSFRTTEVTTSIVTSGSLNVLNISGTVWVPGVSSISLAVNHFASATGTFNFNTSNNQGSAHYTTPGSPQVAVYGTIKITDVSPSLKGTFSFTNPDSTKISGTFLAKKP